MKVLLIDHNDSFTFNLQSWLSRAFEKVSVIEHSKLLEVRDQESVLNLISGYDLVVLSPGPKGPADYPHIQRFLKELPLTQKVLGVCLGLQSMVLALGGTVESYTPPVHGKTGLLHAIGADYVFLNNLKVGRYHSLKCHDYEKEFTCVAQSTGDDVPMWLVAKNKKWQGVQFHPESFLTEKSDLILSKVVDWLKS